MIKKNKLVAVAISEDQREMIRHLYLRFLDGNAEDGDLLDLFPLSDFQELEQQGLVRIEKTETGRDFYFTSLGHQLAQLIAKGHKPVSLPHLN